MSCKHSEQCDNKIICPYARSIKYHTNGGSCYTPKAEQTNEEWLRSATTGELAEWLFRFRHNYRHTLSDCDKMEIEDIDWWLKQPHREENEK